MARPGSAIGNPSSALQQVELVNHQAVFVVAHQRDDDGQAHSGFGRGHDQHEEHEDLAVHVPEIAAESNQLQVGRIEHQLNRHEDVEQVAAQDHARQAGDEQHRRHRQRVIKRDAHPWCAATASSGSSVPPSRARVSASNSSASATRACSSRSSAPRPARPIAPTRPTARTSEASSKGSRKFEYSSCPRFWTLPIWAARAALMLAAGRPLTLMTPNATPSRQASSRMATGAAIPACLWNWWVSMPPRMSSSIIVNRNSTMMAP